MERIVEYFKELGFGKNEIEVYLILVRLGKASVTQIYKNGKIHRQNIYDSLESLTSRGFVYVVEKDKKEYYARDPKSLINFIDRKKQETKKVVEDLKTIESKNLESQVGETKGKFSLNEELYGFLDLKEDIKIIGLNKKFLEVFDQNIVLFNEKKDKLNIKLKIICNTDVINDVKNSFKKNISIKSLPKEYNSNVTFFISKSKIIIVNWTENILLTSIYNKIISTQFEKYFNIFWNSSN